MAGNLDDFLKRAQERRRQKQQQQGGGARNQPPPPPTPQRRPPPPPTPSPRQTPPLRPPVVEVEPDIIIADEAPKPLRSEIDTSDFQDRASHMADEVALADDHMDAHIHEVFDHDVGRLEETSKEKKARRAAEANPIIKMIASKQGIQQAVVMAEILQRPKFLDD